MVGIPPFLSLSVSEKEICVTNENMGMLWEANRGPTRFNVVSPQHHSKYNQYTLEERVKMEGKVPKWLAARHFTQHLDGKLNEAYVHMKNKNNKYKMNTQTEENSN